MYYLKEALQIYKLTITCFLTLYLSKESFPKPKCVLFWREEFVVCWRVIATPCMGCKPIFALMENLSKIIIFQVFLDPIRNKNLTEDKDKCNLFPNDILLGTFSFLTFRWRDGFVDPHFENRKISNFETLSSILVVVLQLCFHLQETSLSFWIFLR